VGGGGGRGASGGLNPFPSGDGNGRFGRGGECELKGFANFSGIANTKKNKKNSGRSFGKRGASDSLMGGGGGGPGIFLFARGCGRVGQREPLNKKNKTHHTKKTKKLCPAGPGWGAGRMVLRFFFLFRIFT